ncbi:putative RING/FYVE/PHD zinc finger superfamily protein [Quillaja saponaria]|uniref:RING/FYVE/PHD zinc finger superfamily protein n=1 Tax=Quillaja saponaria TaxID=32244 RepID=A0AAD7PZU6_QUISA|nr:putative RING/FYVE/PHD zinc finger superfamily protein [Quillaja saponaria]
MVGMNWEIYLTNLIEKAPIVPDDFDKNTREMVSLRCLEGLFGHATGVTRNACSSPGAKEGFDFSQSSEDVLQHILDKVQLLNMRIDGPELLQWNVQPFILHKKARMTKCALQQLKESIVEGTHPYTDYLKERSGLATVEEGGHADQVDDVCHNATAWKINEICSYAKHTRAKGKPETGNKLLEHLPCENSLSLKRYRIKAANEYVCGNLNGSHDGTDECDFHVSAKKFKHHTSSNLESKKENPISQRGRELSENSTERVLLTEREESDTKKDLTDILEEDRVFEDSYDESMGSKSGHISNDEVHHNQSNIPYSTTASMVPQHAPGDESCPNVSIPLPKNGPISSVLPDNTQHEICGSKSQSKCDKDFQLKAPQTACPGGSQMIATDEAKDDTNRYCDAEASGDSDGYHNEKIDIATKKHEFLSSQCSFGLDLSSGAEWTDQNLCMKCNTGGQLLVCSKTTCPLVVHEICLGTSGTFDANGNFYCPFCAYSLAISDYLEAKEKASLARKELATFICKCMGHQAKEHINTVPEKEPSPLKKSEDYNLRGNSNGNEHLLRREDDRVYHVGEHINDVNNIPTENCAYNQQQADPSMSCNNVYSSCREEETVINGLVNVVKVEKKGEDKVIRENATVRGLEEQNQVPSNYLCAGDKFSSEKAIVVFAKQSNIKEEIQDEMLDKQNSALDIEADKDSQASMRLRRREKHYASQARHQLRRKKVPWTADEEKILKEGVQKFASTSDRGIPWRQILEFGGNVFLNGRTPVDLKDKWRNMCKSSPKWK